MTRERANQILNAWREGATFSRTVIALALHATGDLVFRPRITLKGWEWHR